MVQQNEYRTWAAPGKTVGLGLQVLVDLGGSRLGRNTRGGAIIVGALNFGGLIRNAVSIAEFTIDEQAQTLLMLIGAPAVE
jgi:ATP-dependent Lon protease